MSCQMKWTWKKMYFLLVVGTVCSLEITTTRYVDTAFGESAKLGCLFTLSPDDRGNLEIEWNLKPVDPHMDEKPLILFTAGQTYVMEPYKSRVRFHSLEPQNGDASINLLTVTASDSGTYECKVKKVPGIQLKLITLRVLYAPSQLQCTTDGVTYVGTDVALRCEAGEGTLPLTYTWERTTEPKVFPPFAKVSSVTGKVYIQDVREEDSGTYQCTVKNRVGTDKCFVHLSITTFSFFSSPGPKAAVVIAVIVLIKAVVVIFIYCYRRKQKSEEYVMNDILADAAPPIVKSH